MPKDVTYIQDFREQIGLSQQQLGERIGVTRQTVAAWEKGDREPSVLQLARIARELHVPLDALLGAVQDEEAVLLFRADDPEVLSTGLRQRLSDKAEGYAAIERLAGELSVLPESRPLDDYDAHLVEQVAREIRDWLGVEDAPLGDVLALLEGKGLKIICHPLPNEVSGFSAYTEDWGGVIVVNGKHALERQYFTCLHELGHLIFHRREYSQPNRKAGVRGNPREKAAHHFASAVLLPREVMEDELRAFAFGWIPDPVLADMKLRYGVSMRTVLFRAGYLELISKRQAGQQVGILNKTYGKEDEPVKLPVPKPEERPTRRLERLTYRALIHEKITASRAAEVMDKPLLEVRQRLADYLKKPATGAPGT
jgi:Zn-dependent peptidase ImmA (M78 family)/DNA-binding XRE family transcriptional regulator